MYLSIILNHAEPVNYLKKEVNNMVFVSAAEFERKTKQLIDKYGEDTTELKNNLFKLMQDTLISLGYESGVDKMNNVLKGGQYDK